MLLLGWGGGIRTPECQDQNLVPYHLATPQYLNDDCKGSNPDSPREEEFDSPLASPKLRDWQQVAIGRFPCELPLAVLTPNARTLGAPAKSAKRILWGIKPGALPLGHSPPILKDNLRFSFNAAFGIPEFQQAGTAATTFPYSPSKKKEK
jgi:hypothetical protein